MSPMRDKRTNEQLKIEVLSQWKLEAESLKKQKGKTPGLQSKANERWRKGRLGFLFRQKRKSGSFQ